MGDSGDLIGQEEVCQFSRKRFKALHSTATTSSIPLLVYL